MTSLHARTPTLAVIDPRGLPIRTVAFACSASGQASEQRVTQSVFDPMGRRGVQAFVTHFLEGNTAQHPISPTSLIR